MAAPLGATRDPASVIGDLMRSYCSLYIDAGYLMAASSTRVVGTSLRSATTMNVPGLLAGLTAQVEADSGLPLLRIHWYDSGTRTGAAVPEQREIAAIPRVKLRLGRVGMNGEQKGVDLKLALDLITHSRNKVAEVVYLVSGDDDLSEAVEEAQHLGVQVITMGVPTTDGKAIAVSRNLQMTADQVHLIDGELLDTHVKRSAAAAIQEVAEASKAPTAPAEATAEAEAEAVPCPAPPVAPSPALLAQTRPPAPIPTRVAAASAPAPATVAYSTSTGEAGHFPGASTADAEVDLAVDDVVGKVVDNWWRGASRQARADLLAARPIIPSEIDRTLLNDLSNTLGVYDVPMQWRYALRDAFWERIDAV